MARNKKKDANIHAKNRLRIIGGQWRGRKLQFLDAPGLRPTPDRVRETLFNWLNPHITHARCLDLFSGSGALSIEALSRSAEFATLIDQSIHITRHLKHNLSVLSCTAAEVITADALSWLAQLQPNQIAPYDIVFLDPPFHQGLIEQCSHLLEQKKLLQTGSYIYIETETSLIPDIPDCWQLERKKGAGQVISHLYIRNQPSSTI